MILFSSCGRLLLGFLFGGNLNPKVRDRERFISIRTVLTVHTITAMRDSRMLWPLYASYTDTKKPSREITLTERGLSGSIYLALLLHSLFRTSPPPPPPAWWWRKGLGNRGRRPERKHHRGILSLQLFSAWQQSLSTGDASYSSPVKRINQPLRVPESRKINRQHPVLLWHSWAVQITCPSPHILPPSSQLCSTATANPQRLDSWWWLGFGPGCGCYLGGLLHFYLDSLHTMGQCCYHHITVTQLFFFLTIILFIPFFPCHPVTKKGKSRIGHVLFNICVNVRMQACFYSFAFCNECVIPDILGINKAYCFILFILVIWFAIISPAEGGRNVDFSLYIIAQPWLIKYTICSDFCVLFYFWLTLIRTSSLYSK